MSAVDREDRAEERSGEALDAYSRTVIGVAEALMKPARIRPAAVEATPRERVEVWGIDRLDVDSSCVGLTGSPTVVRAVRADAVDRRGVGVIDIDVAGADQHSEFLSVVRRFLIQHCCCRRGSGAFRKHLQQSLGIASDGGFDLQRRQSAREKRRIPPATAVPVRIICQGSARITWRGFSPCR